MRYTEVKIHPLWGRIVCCLECGGGECDTIIPAGNEAQHDEEFHRPYVCPGCHAMAPKRCLPGCIDAEIEAENQARDYDDEADYGDGEVS